MDEFNLDAAWSGVTPRNQKAVMNAMVPCAISAATLRRLRRNGLPGGGKSQGDGEGIVDPPGPPENGIVAVCSRLVLKRRCA
jgi:hypothetical protein